MALDDLYEVTQQLVFTSGERAVSVFSYICTDNGNGVGTADELVTAFRVSIWGVMQSDLCDQWTSEFWEARNLNDDEDWYRFEGSESGDLTGDALPAVLAVGFRSPKQDTGKNRSHHQLPLLDQTTLAGDGSMTVAARDAMYFTQQAMGLPIVNATQMSEFTPCTVKKVYDGGVLVSASLRSVVTGQWSINRYFSTQKSRQSLNWEVAEEPMA